MHVMQSCSVTLSQDPGVFPFQPFASVDSKNMVWLVWNRTVKSNAIYHHRQFKKFKSFSPKDLLLWCCAKHPNRGKCSTVELYREWFARPSTPLDLLSPICRSYTHYPSKRQFQPLHLGKHLSKDWLQTNVSTSLNFKKFKCHQRLVPGHKNN